MQNMNNLQYLSNKITLKCKKYTRQSRDYVFNKFKQVAHNVNGCSAQMNHLDWFLTEVKEVSAMNEQ